MTETYVTFLAAAGLNPEAGALSLDVTDTPTGVALLRRDAARRGAGRGFVARLAAVVAEPLLRRTIFRNVAHWVAV